MKCREVFNTAYGVANRQGSWIKWPLGPLLAVNLLKRNTFTNTIIGQEKTWHIASISNTPRFLFVMFKPTNLNQAL